MQQLSGLDAAFLYLESSAAPMHVGGVYLFESARQLDFEAFRQHIAARLHVSRTFRQRLAAAPLNVDHPYWIEDPAFDLEAHLDQRELPEPGGWPELMNLAGEIFSEPLDRGRPLWSLTFVAGLNRIPGAPPGAFALIAKAHHAAVDGVSGEEMIWALLDDPTAETPAPAPAPWQPEAPPGLLRLLAGGATRLLEQPARLANLAGHLAGGALRAAVIRTLMGIPLPPLLLTAPATPLNQPVTRERLFRGALLPLARLKAIRSAVPGTTINDVALAICAGALRRYLQDNNALPDQPLIAAVPISVRAPDEIANRGNRVSAALVALATEVEDPRERLQLIHDGAADAMTYSRALGLDRLTDFIPAASTAPLVRLYCWLKLAQRVGPLFNLFITNVPGPRQPLYLNGARLLGHWGMAPVFDGLGLILVITSYLDTLAISATACRQVMPDLDAFIGHLEASLDELEAAAVPATVNGVHHG